MTRHSDASDPAMKQGDVLVTSSSQLLAPSANSTHRPSRSNLDNYGASDDSMSRNDSAASFELLLPRQSQRKGSVLKSKIQHYCRKRPALVAAVLLTFAGIVALTVTSAFPSVFKSRGHFGGKKHRLVVNERAPFSTLDPVKDLGLYPLSRPEASGPPDSVLRGTQQHALPTNTWYQNLLMAKGEPSDVHRAYPMPYVVDMVGPIPGLRAHPNHLDASTTVVQLSFVDSHGLTLGAAAADGTGGSDDSPHKKYSVISTTALAATLEWVSATDSALCAIPFYDDIHSTDHFSVNRPLFPCPPRLSKACRTRQCSIRNRSLLRNCFPQSLPS